MERHRAADMRTDGREARRPRRRVPLRREPRSRSDAPARSILSQPRLPLNRILTLLGPYISLVSGALAAWLSQHFPGLASRAPANTKEITQAVTFVVGSLVTWALQHRYLVGWQSWEQGLMDLEKAARGSGGNGGSGGGGGGAASSSQYVGRGDGPGDESPAGSGDDPDDYYQAYDASAGDYGEPDFNANLVFDPTANPHS